MSLDTASAIAAPENIDLPDTPDTFPLATDPEPEPLTPELPPLPLPMDTTVERIAQELERTSDSL